MFVCEKSQIQFSGFLQQLHLFLLTLSPQVSWAEFSTGKRVESLLHCHPKQNHSSTYKLDFFFLLQKAENVFFVNRKSSLFSYFFGTIRVKPEGNETFFFLLKFTVLDAMHWLSGRGQNESQMSQCSTSTNNIHNSWTTGLLPPTTVFPRVRGCRGNGERDSFVS